MISDMCNSKVSLIKNNEVYRENVKALITGDDKIFIPDETIPLEEGDLISRKLPSGLIERFVVLDRGFFARTCGIDGHYQAKVRKEGIINNKGQDKNITINLNGTQNKINIDTIDVSANYYLQNEEKLFEDLKNVLKNNIMEKDVLDKAINIASQMKQNTGKTTFKEKYKDFMAVLANHITIIAPFLPALTQFL